MSFRRGVVGGVSGVIGGRIWWRRVLGLFGLCLLLSLFANNVLLAPFGDGHLVLGPFTCLSINVRVALSV